MKKIKYLLATIKYYLSIVGIYVSFVFSNAITFIKSIFFGPAFSILIYYRAYKDPDFKDIVLNALHTKNLKSIFEDGYLFDIKTSTTSELTRHTACFFWLTILFVYNLIY